MAGRRLVSRAVATVFVWTGLAVTQTATDPNLIHLNVDLIQVEAVVTDSSGRQKTDLTPDSFEVFQDGKPRTISSLNYVQIAQRPKTQSAASRVDQTPARETAAEIPRRLGQTDVQRAVYFVVDDRGLSGDSMQRVRGSLQQFVNGEFQPGDLFALSTTGMATKSITQFTSDLRLIDAAIEDLRYSAASRVSPSSVAPVKGRRGWFTDRVPSGEQKVAALNTIDDLQKLVERMSGVPGRKLMILISENLPITFGGAGDQRVNDGLERLTHSAARGSVEISTLDPRGVQAISLTADDELHRWVPQEIAQMESHRSDDILDSQEGLALIARSTGGLFVHDVNDLALGLKKVMSDAEGYYLIGFRPDLSGTNKDRDSVLHKVEIKLVTPGLKVRYRKGFSTTEPIESSAEPDLERVLTSPLDAEGLRVRATSFISENGRQGQFVNCLVYVDPHDLTFRDGVASIRLRSLALDEIGQVIDQQDHLYQLTPKTESFAGSEPGAIYAIHFDLKHAGVYEMHVAVVDGNSHRVGSAHEVFVAPDLRAGRLALSSILLQAQTADASIPLTAAAEGRLPVADPIASAAVRVFRPGSTVTYAYLIFNAHCDHGKSPDLEAQTRIFRDGRQVYASPATPVNAAHQEPDRLVSTWATKLGTSLGAGHYALQVVVTDHHADKASTASQCVDFEIEP